MRTETGLCPAAARRRARDSSAAWERVERAYAAQGYYPPRADLAAQMKDNIVEHGERLLEMQYAYGLALGNLCGRTDGFFLCVDTARLHRWAERQETREKENYSARRDELLAQAAGLAECEALRAAGEAFFRDAYLLCTFHYFSAGLRRGYAVGRLSSELICAVASNQDAGAPRSQEE